MDKYSFNVRWSNDDACYIAVCPEFPTLSGLGETREEAVAELQTVITAAIEVYQEEGWDLPEPHTQGTYSGKLLVRMPKNLHATLAQEAESEGVSLNTLVVTMLSGSLGVASVRTALLEMREAVKAEVWQHIASHPVLRAAQRVPAMFFVQNGKTVGPGPQALVVASQQQSVSVVQLTRASRSRLSVNEPSLARQDE